MYSLPFSASSIELWLQTSKPCLKLFCLQKSHLINVSISVKLAVVSNFDTRLRKLLKDLHVSDM